MKKEIKKKTLLQRALEIKSRKSIETSDEKIELAIAWLEDDIGTRQVAEVIEEPEVGGRVLYRLSVWLREACRQKKIKIISNLKKEYEK